MGFIQNPQNYAILITMYVLLEYAQSIFNIIELYWQQKH